MRVITFQMNIITASTSSISELIIHTYAGSSLYSERRLHLYSSLVCSSLFLSVFSSGSLRGLFMTLFLINYLFILGSVIFPLNPITTQLDASPQSAALLFLLLLFYCCCSFIAFLYSPIVLDKFSSLPHIQEVTSKKLVKL